jgi:hypothetical protein
VRRNASSRGVAGKQTGLFVSNLYDACLIDARFARYFYTAQVLDQLGLASIGGAFAAAASGLKWPFHARCHAVSGMCRN